jgi:hypothetical protein
VDFSDFYRAIAELTEAQRETLNAETNPKSGYETIAEESESSLTYPTIGFFDGNTYINKPQNTCISILMFIMILI